MNGSSHHGKTALRGVLVTTCLIAGIVWPNWWKSLQAAETCNSSTDCIGNQQCAGGGIGYAVDEPLSVTKSLKTCAPTCSATDDCDVGVCTKFGGPDSGGVCVLDFEPGVTTGGPTPGGGKTEFPIIPVLPPVTPEPPAPPTPDAILSTQYGVPLDTSRNGLYGGDSLFQGSRGAELRQAILATAAKYGIDAGVLANFVFAELGGSNAQKAATLTGATPVKNTAVGLDYWGGSLGKAVMRHVFGAGDIMSTVLPEHFTNRNGKDTGPIHEFRDGPTALGAMAATIRFFEIRLITKRQIGRNAWDSLLDVTRFEILRYYYNAGAGKGLKLARTAAAGQDIAIPSGDDGPKHPQRTATIRAAQAKHLRQILGKQ
jgi:hypothetical protein